MWWNRTKAMRENGGSRNPTGYNVVKINTVVKHSCCHCMWHKTSVQKPQICWQWNSARYAQLTLWVLNLTLFSTTFFRWWLLSGSFFHHLLPITISELIQRLFSLWFLHCKLDSKLYSKPFCKHQIQKNQTRLNVAILFICSLTFGICAVISQCGFAVFTYVKVMYTPSITGNIV